MTDTKKFDFQEFDLQCVIGTYLSSESSFGNLPWDWTDRCTSRRHFVPPDIPRRNLRAPARPVRRLRGPWCPYPWPPCSDYPAQSGLPFRKRSTGIDLRYWTRGRDANGRLSNGCCPPSRWPDIPTPPLKRAKENIILSKTFRANNSFEYKRKFRKTVRLV